MFLSRLIRPGNDRRTQPPAANSESDPNAAYRNSRGDRIALGNKLASGGEGAVYEVPSRPGQIAKIYTRKSDGIDSKLKLMVANPPRTKTRKGHVYIAWPDDILYENHYEEAIGFLMPYIKKPHQIVSCYNPRRRRNNLSHFNYEYLLTVGQNLSTAINALHAGDYVVGDINEGNILVNDRAQVTLIDADSFQVRDKRQGKVYYCRVGRPEHTPPELHGKNFDNLDRTAHHDGFGLAVVIFQLLMEGNHPFDGIYTGIGEPPSTSTKDRIVARQFPYTQRGNVPYRPKTRLSLIWESLPPALRSLFERSFDVAHRDNVKRPTALEWQTALRDATKSLSECRQNTQHKYFLHNRQCTWCRIAAQPGQHDPFPPLPAGARQPIVSTRSDQNLVCRDCGRPFVFTVGEQEFYDLRGYQFPKRCPECREARREARRDPLQNDAGTSINGRFPIICAKCGNPDTVPFRPDGLRPVYCGPCFHQLRR